MWYSQHNPNQALRNQIQNPSANENFLYGLNFHQLNIREMDKNYIKRITLS